MHNEVDPSSYKTIDSLLQQCKKINSKFEKIDFSEVNCTSKAIDSAHYCSELSKVSNCFNIADSLDTLLKHEKII